MFGFLSLVFTMQERVESSIEMVRGWGNLGVYESMCWVF
jgi:hypothetical protein